MKVFLGSLLLVLLISSGHAATVTLTWDYVQGSDAATSFALYRQESCSGNAQRIEVPISVQTYTDTGPFLTNIMYCYTVTAVDAAGLESAPSNTVMFQMQEERPQAPFNVRGTVGP